MRLLLLIMLVSTSAFAEHECKEYAFEKAAKYVELFFCDSYIPNCKVDEEKITVANVEIAESYPSMDFYSLKVPLTGADIDSLNVPVEVGVGRIGADSDLCTTYNLMMGEMDEEE